MSAKSSKRVGVDRDTQRATFSLTDTSVEQVRKLGELFQMQPSAVVAQAIARWFYSEPVALTVPGVAVWFYNPKYDPTKDPELPKLTAAQGSEYCDEESNGAGNSKL